MKLLVLIIIFFPISVGAQSPSWIWAKVLSSNESVYSSGLAKDKSNNLIISGYSNYSNLFDLPKGGFIAKVNSHGEKIWASYVNAHAEDVATDSSDNIVAIGTFDYELKFNDSILVTGKGSRIAYLISLANDGRLNWFRILGDSNSADGISVSIDSKNNVIATCNFNKSLRIGDTLFVATNSPNGFDGFLMKYSSNGDTIWSTKMNSEWVYESCVDKEDNIYVCGRSDLPFIADSVISDTSNHPDYLVYLSFVSKFNSNGQCEFAKSVWNCEIFGITSDTNNDIITTGYFWETYQSDDLKLTNGDHDIFTTKYTALGSPLWVRAIRSNHGYGCEVITDLSGNILVAARSGWAFVEDSIVQSDKQSEGLVVCYDKNGNSKWMKIINAAHMVGYMTGLVFISTKELIVTCYYNQSTLTLDDIVIPEATTGKTSLLIAGLEIPTTSVNPHKADHSNGSISIKYNGLNNISVQYYTTSPSPVTITLHDILGREVLRRELGAQAEGQHEESLDVSGLPIGSYIVKISTNQEVFTSRISVVR